MLYDCWKMCVMMGAICSAVSLRTLAGSSSGPVALFWLRFFNCLIMPFVPMSRGGMLEYCSTVWNPYIPARHYLGMTDQVEKVQRYFTRRVYQRCQLDCNHSYLQRLTCLKVESLELRRIYLD